MKSFRYFPLLFVGLVAAGCAPKTNTASTDNATGTAANSSASTGAASGASTGTVTIISPHTREIQTEFTALWKSKNPGVEIKWIDQGGTSQDLSFIRQQFSKEGAKEKGIGIDLFFGGGGETYSELEEDGVLAPLPSSYSIPAELNGVPLRGKDNVWVAAALSGFGILYNKKIAARDKLPVPQTWADLTNPKLRDRIGLADPRQSGSAHTAYEIILQSNGWDKGWKVLTAMTGNARAFATSASEPLQDVQNGEAVFCPAIDFYALNTILKAGEDKLGYIEPKGQYVVTADPIAMLAGAPNSEGAKKFVQLVMSSEGQKLWYLPKGSAGGPKNSDLFRLPALPTSYKPIPKNATAKIDPYANKNISKYDADKAAQRRRALDDLIGATLIDNHDAIKSAWEKNPDLETTGFVPISEAEFMKIAVQWDDSKVSNEYKSKWLAASTAKFQ